MWNRYAKIFSTVMEMEFIFFILEIRGERGGGGKEGGEAKEKISS